MRIVPVVFLRIPAVLISAIAAMIIIPLLVLGLAIGIVISLFQILFQSSLIAGIAVSVMLVLMVGGIVTTLWRVSRAHASYPL